MAAHMTALLRRDGDGSTDKCITSLHHDNYRQHYSGFEYTSACPVNMISHMNSCTQKMTPLQFDEHNDLIVRSDKASVRKACASYREWMECMQQVSSSCSQGINKALDLEDGRARRYFRKLAFICGSKGSEYQTHLSCYKKSVKKESAAVSPCFKEVKAALQPSHAYTFFCLPHSAFTIDVKQKLVAVRGCYERFYSAKCSHAAAAIMGEMIEQAFDDPHYLRMGFRPDCHLHNASRDSLLASHADVIDSHGRNVIGDKGEGRDEPPIASHKEESMFSAFTSSTTSTDSQHAVPSVGITSTPIPSALVYLDSDIRADARPVSEWPVGDGRGEEGGVLLPANSSRSGNFSNSPLMPSIQGPSNDTFVQQPLPPSTKLPPASVHTTLPTPTTIVNTSPPSHHDHRHSSVSAPNSSKPALTSHHRSTSMSADNHPSPADEGTSQHKHGGVRAALASSAVRPYVTMLTAVGLVTYSVTLAVATR